MINLSKEIRGNDSIIIVFSKNYQKELLSVIKKLTGLFDRICYVSLNKPYDFLVKHFKSNKVNIEKLFFIDAVTKSSVTNPPSVKNCLFISSPGALTELSITISEVNKVYMPDVIFFDSASTFLIYEKEEVVVKFLHHIINSLRGQSIKVISAVMEDDVESVLMKDLIMFADTTLNLVEGKKK